MSKIPADSNAFNLVFVAGILIVHLLTSWSWSCSAHQISLLSPIKSNMTEQNVQYDKNGTQATTTIRALLQTQPIQPSDHRNNDTELRTLILRQVYILDDDNLAVTNKPINQTRTTTISPYNSIKPVVLNNKTDSVTVTEKNGTKWGWPWKEKKDEEKKEIKIPDDFGAKETKPKGKGRSWTWPTVIIVVTVCIVAVICADNKSCIYIFVSRSNHRNTAGDIEQAPGVPENPTTNLIAPRNQSSERRFSFPPIRAQPFQDNPPPYPGRPHIDTSPPPPYASGWVRLGLKNNALISKL